MNPAGWQDVKRILQTALELPSEERSPYLDRACCSDPDLRREVEAYLRYEDVAGTAFSVTGWQSTLNSTDEVVADPERAGPYRILRRIAEGGMGVVYLAERDDGQYRQQVAVKVMKAGPQDAGLMRRFRNERQILAELDHPNIARLIDGGTMATGQLYYVMEYVDGVPVTTYCNARRLTLRQRVQLFSAICLAVVHAHRKLIVHGDVKPANILVSSDGTPKVVDFGLAKVFRAASEAGEASSTTVMLTPGYASPEQITGGRLGMAADVYSLGVLLCELLTAGSPYALTGKTPFEVCRAVLDEDPRPPSAILRHRSRSAEPEIPIAPRQLKGDLDAIVLKALRKEPESRYGSVEELRDEIERYLAGLPVRASRGNVLYRCRKFVKRRSWALAAAAFIAIGAISATTTVWWEGRQAEMRFNDVRALAHSVIFELHDAIQDLPGSTAARKLLVERALEYLRKLESNGGTRHDLQLELASAYQKIGEVQSDASRGSISDTPAALSSLQQARRLLLNALRTAPDDPGPQEMLRDLDLKLALVQEQLGDEAGRASAGREAAEIGWALANRHPDSRRLKADALRITAQNLTSVGDWDRALPAWKSAVAAYQAALDEVPHDSGLLGRLATSYDGVGEACKQLDRLDCAMEYYGQAVKIRSAELAQAPSDTRSAMLLSYHLIDLAWVEHRGGAQSQAIADEERALGLQRAIAAADARNLMARLETAKTLVTRGLIYRDGGDSARAMASLREAIGIFESGLERDPDNESTVFHLAWSNAELGEIHRHLALTNRHGAAAVDSEWRNAAACFERSNRYLQDLNLGGKLMGILDDRNLREQVPKKLAECRRHL